MSYSGCANCTNMLKPHICWSCEDESEFVGEDRSNLREDITPSSGNVFVDVGLPADTGEKVLAERLAKAKAAIRQYFEMERDARGAWMSDYTPPCDAFQYESEVDTDMIARDVLTALGMLHVRPENL